jgi:hypothetical protein
MEKGHDVAAGFVSEYVKEVSHNSVAYKALRRSTMASAV